MNQPETCRGASGLAILEVLQLETVSIRNIFVFLHCLGNPIILYNADPETKAWLEHHKHSIFGFPTLVRFSWGTCTMYFKDGAEVVW